MPETDAARLARETETRAALRLPHRTPSEPPTADRIACWLARSLRILSQGHTLDPTGGVVPVADLSTVRRFDRVEDEGIDLEVTGHGSSFVLINHAGVRFRVTVERD